MACFALKLKALWLRDCNLRQRKPGHSSGWLKRSRHRGMVKAESYRPVSADTTAGRVRPPVLTINTSRVDAEVCSTNTVTVWHCKILARHDMRSCRCLDDGVLSHFAAAVLKSVDLAISAGGMNTLCISLIFLVAVADFCAGRLQPEKCVPGRSSVFEPCRDVSGSLTERCVPCW